MTAATGSEPRDPRGGCECKVPESCIRCNSPQFLNNVLLIAAQRPDATAVAGFGAWKALGRQVDKGSKGIAILAPLTRRSRPDAAAGGPATGPQGPGEVRGGGSG